MKKLIITLLAASSMAFADPVQEKQQGDDNSINSIINSHLQRYRKQEMLSAIQVSIKTKDKINSYALGTRANNSEEAISTRDLFDLGSITKSFTAALAVLAESEGKIKLDSPLSDYLREYPNWGSLSLTKLLNMSTGIPNYSDSPRINYLFSKNIQRSWSPTELIDLVYTKNFNPPLKPGYFYSNTGYVLVAMILANKYNDSFANLLDEKILKPLDLKNTFYPVPNYRPEVLQRMVRGYAYNVYDNPELVGQDVTENSLSWAGPAGALVANSEDVIHWVEHLFIDDKLLTRQQKDEMQKLVSTETGKLLAITNSDEPRGFGLGVVQAYNSKIGHYWFYEGKTLGYRSFYFYVPCNQVIISALFNSVTNSENDHGHELIQALYNYILKQDQSLNCRAEKTSGKNSA
ncbi:D-alanyl-D-alanine carboxypeptidase precursor [Legionella massiliensis]|uniref:D-alanyl-D-alanine carboxypeptidase n=1 Tax=Legionella massiliensis TaxID=1034943 RepID=A0A078KWY0_9GAMM|nr:serine hydrolase domain-containing protein [Legionella massiliensis]CDZ76284.1 D-alanyl-D-alanine carboxypeptidase precursor [Legionella massiliensis]CEE12022.1 D-alanyl-D-alanine carboxypeptidase precursor [Legionella massiliensis]